MGIRLVTFYNSTVTPQDDALIYENALPASGMIYGGNVTIKNANTLHISAGHGALCGRKFTIEEDDIPIILTSSGTLNGRLYIHMDLSDTGEPISLEVERANVLTPVVQQSNVNINDGIYEINLATFTISTSTVSDLNYVAPFIRDLDAREVIIAPVEPTNIASSNYAIGRRLILNKVLYRVTATITAEQTITPGTNVTESNSVEEQIEANLSSINTINSNKLNQSVIATRQSNLIASKDYVIGEQFVYNNILYRATAAIARNATITIGGNATTADSISSQISNFAKYSTSETDTGRRWIDGKIIYRKVINFGNLPNTATKSVNHNISGLSFVTLLSAIVYSTSGTQSWQMLNFASSVGVEQTIRIFCGTTQVTIGTGTDRSSLKAYVIMEYTK